MYFDPLFWLLIAIAFMVLQWVPTLAVRIRAAILSLLGIVGIGLILKISLLGAGLLTMSVLFLWLGCRRLAARGASDRTGLALLAIAPLLVTWVLGKVGIALDLPRLAPLLFVGMSYLLVKSWSLLKDIVDGKVRDVDPFEVTAYLLHLPTFLLGPMHYFGEFQDTLRRPYTLTGESFLDILYRFVLGLFKVYGLAGLLAPVSLLGLAQDQNYHLSNLLVGAFAYSLVLYLDFSGYCDMAIAVSRLLGIEVPENFNWPYLASSIRDFWRRWHITFSRALTAHVFVPMTRSLQRRWPKSPGWISTAGYGGTFLFCGFWHGATPNFLLWGLWHAVGFIIQDAWTRYRYSRWVKPGRSNGALDRTLDTLLTFAFVSVGWIFFVLPWGKLVQIRVW
jgi:D-alanyl-lipoteichoic acid acyltransferase DltB (MBOAT superfamily)